MTASEEDSSIDRQSLPNMSEPKVGYEVQLVEDSVPRLREHFYKASTPEEEALDRSINRKIDFIVLPLLAINFMLAGIDKNNIGNAATTTFAKDANLAMNDISDAVSLLSVTFITFQPFSTIVGRRVGPKIWIPCMMVLWGCLCAAHAGIKNRGTLIALRLLLGMAEAGFVPTVFYYLSTLYPKYHLGFRMGLFAGMYSIAGAFASLIAYGIFQIKSPVLKGWQMLFLIEGLITIFMATLTFLVLPKDKGTAWFLTPAEREHAVHRIEVDVEMIMELDAEGRPKAESRNVTRRDVTDVLKDWRKLCTVVFNVLATLPVSAFGTFLPLIVSGMGFTGLQANLMSVSPFIAGAFGLFCFVYSSDRFRERSLHTVISMGLALIGVIVMATSTNPTLRYGFTHVCLAGAFSSGPLIVTWLAGNTPLTGPRSIIIGINGYSNLAGVIAGQLFKAQYAPSYSFPLTVTMILIAIGMLGFLSIRLIYMFTNRWRQRKTKDWTASQVLEERNSVVRRGDQKYTFVYSY